MEKQYYSDRGDLKISGSARAGGGKYNKVSVSGDANIKGDIDCVDFRCSGSSRIEGNIKASEYKISGSDTIDGNINTLKYSVSGSGNINGSLDAEEFRISGSSRIKGDASAKEFKVTGDCHIGGALKGENVKIYGEARIGTNCEAETFLCSGSFQIGEMLNAELVDITLYGNCKAMEIGGKDIEVRINPKKLSVLKMLFTVGNRRSRLNADVIEGDNIYLEGTNSRVVRGKHVTIGEGCNIERVEYSDSISVIKGAAVKEQVKCDK